MAQHNNDSSDNNDNHNSYSDNDKNGNDNNNNDKSRLSISGLASSVIPNLELNDSLQLQMTIYFKVI